MDNTTNLSFDDDADSLGGVIYFNRAAYSEFTDLMNHTEEDAFDAHIDDLIAKHRYEELAQYSFLSFVKPADYDRKQHSIEPLGPERADWSAANEEAIDHVSSAKRHFHLMWFCAHPEEVQKLQNEILLSTEDLGKLRGVGDPRWIEECRKYLASTIRQVERMKRKYTVTEIEAANASVDEMDREFPEINDDASSELCDLEDL